MIIFRLYTNKNVMDVPTNLSTSVYNVFYTIHKQREKRYNNCEKDYACRKRYSRCFAMT